jgi:hypothetical protein
MAFDVAKQMRCLAAEMHGRRVKGGAKESGSRPRGKRRLALASERCGARTVCNSPEFHDLVNKTCCARVANSQSSYLLNGIPKLL